MIFRALIFVLLIAIGIWVLYFVVVTSFRYIARRVEGRREILANKLDEKEKENLKEYEKELDKKLNLKKPKQPKYKK